MSDMETDCFYAMRRYTGWTNIRFRSKQYLATESTQKLPQEVAHLFTQIVPDAQLYKKIED